MIEPDYSKMPAGTNMVNLARMVQMPTNKACLRCHATAGGGDWTKRGDFPGGARQNATVFTIRDRAYIVMGENYTQRLSDAWSFKP